MPMRRQPRFPRESPHRTPTRHAAALWTGLSEGGLGPNGCYWGEDLLGGGSFCLDHWNLYDRVPRIVNSGDVVVFGEKGNGKSTAVKAFYYRQVDQFGRRAVVLDPKPEGAYGGRGEWTGIAQELGVQSIRPDHEGTFVINPITNAAPEPARLEQLNNIAVIATGRPLSGTERNGLRVAMLTADQHLAPTAASGETTIPLVASMMLRPQQTVGGAAGHEVARRMARDLGYVDASGNANLTKMLDALRDVGSALEALMSGDLRGMFDGPTTLRDAFRQRFVHLDLSAIYHTTAVSVIAVVAAGALRTEVAAALGRGDDSRLLFGVDEGGIVAQNPEWGRFRYSSEKFGRGLGYSHWDIYQLPSDLYVAGAAGTVDERMSVIRARDAATKVAFHLPSSEADHLLELGFTDTEVQHVLNAPEQVCLVKVAARSFLVHPVITDLEEPMVNTNAGMRGGSKPQLEVVA